MTPEQADNLKKLVEAGTLSAADVAAIQAADAKHRETHQPEPESKE